MFTRRRFAGMAMGLAVAVVAGIIPASSAAAEIKQGPDLPPVTEAFKKLAVQKKDLPAGAKKATRGPFEAGARARAFESPSKKQRIVGGTPVNAADFPSVVGIHTFFVNAADNYNWYYSTCTGTVLDAKHVLTAGHCIVDFPLGYTYVMAGRNNLETDTSGFVARVHSTWTHQGFNYQQLINDPNGSVPLDDVSVLTLKDALPSVYTPVQLAAQGAADPAADTAATIVGYGVTSAGADDMGILRAGQVKIASDATCGSSSQWGSWFDPNRMMCAGLPPTTDTCNGDSGGPIFTGPAGSYTQVGITDWGSEICGSRLGVYEALNYYNASITAAKNLAPANNLDWTGDGHSDLMARDPYDGSLVVASGSGLANGTLDGFSGDIMYASTSDFRKYNKLFRVNDWNGNGNPSMFARDADGRLWDFRSNGIGDFSGKGVQVGSGWNKFTDIMVTNNWIGNGLPNVMGRTSNGELWRFDSNGRGGWLTSKGTRIGTGWNQFNTVLTPGSWLGDGKQSLIGRTKTDGKLRLYTSNGAGGWTSSKGVQIGSGWNGFKTFMSPGDWNGDNLVDLIAVRPNGEMKMYATNGKGQWLSANGRVIGQDWDYFNAIF